MNISDAASRLGKYPPLATCTSVNTCLLTCDTILKIEGKKVFRSVTSKYNHDIAVILCASKRFILTTRLHIVEGLIKVRQMKRLLIFKCRIVKYVNQE